MIFSFSRIRYTPHCMKKACEIDIVAISNKSKVGKIIHEPQGTHFARA